MLVRRTVVVRCELCLITSKGEKNQVRPAPPCPTKTAGGGWGAQLFLQKTPIIKKEKRQVQLECNWGRRGVASAFGVTGARPFGYWLLVTCHEGQRNMREDFLGFWWS